MEQFQCRRLCSKQGRWLRDRRAGQHCTLIDFDGEWTGTHWSGAFLEWYGRKPAYDIPAKRLAETAPNRSQERPSEDPAEGCPGGWYRNRFAQSFNRYRRGRTEAGRIDNPRIHKDTAPLILEAVEFFEAEEEAAEGRYIEARYG